MRIIALAVLSLVIASPVSGKVRFQPYEGKNTVFDGQGGTRTEKDGVDFWTFGSPPRRFQVIGIITDRRGSGPLSGDAVGSPSVAKKVKEAGGDAVIMMHRDSQVTGVVTGSQATGYGNQVVGSGWAVPVSKNLTTFVVIRYVDPVPAE